MKHLTYTLSALILFISLSACAQNKRKGNGSLITKERSIEILTPQKSPAPLMLN